jgi:formylglycine-generating enzyme required for sulfatase activity
VKSADQNSAVFPLAIGRVWRDLPVAPEMVVLPAGCFVMGENENDKFANDTERPRHRVMISAQLAMARFSVTNAQFRAFDSMVHGPDDLPIVKVSWDQANDYCAWLTEQTDHTYRLPSEAEWEYACRSGNKWPFYRGTELTTAEANYLYDEDGRKVGPGKLTPFGCYPVNGFGIGDMLGNVCEWVGDCWHPNYVGAPTDGSSWCNGNESSRRVIRGGAWDYLPRLLRSSWRDWLWQTSRRDNVGFRVAITL